MMGNYTHRESMTRIKKAFAKLSSRRRYMFRFHACIVYNLGRGPFFAT
jgi:hypothetical protein